MLELVFVIVIIGILSAVAVPKLSATRDDAIIAKARSTVSSVQSAIATERQKRILKGDFTHGITSLSANPANIFDRFNPDKDDIAAGRATGNRVLEYPLPTCATLGKSSGCWQMNGANYRYILPNGTTVDFRLNNNRFECVSPSTSLCRLLTQ
jgi:general secretion pathway protein G